MFLVFKMCGMQVTPEDVTNIGRIDATMKIGDYIYIIECKLHKNAEEAIKQIDDNKYAEKYLPEMKNRKKIGCIGINFSYDPKIRNIDDYLVKWL